jgi:hypothetical protein
MPLEGHYARQTTPLHRLSPRERLVGAILIVVVALGTVALVIAAAGNGRAAPNAPGCVAVVDPGTMGAAMSRACGNAARAFCQTPRVRQDSAYGRQLAQACRKAGF